MKRNIITATATAVVLLASVSAYAATATDTQDVMITVPEVALLDVNDAGITFVCALTAQTAGANFQCDGSAGATSAAVTSTYAMTTNTSSIATTTRSLTITPSADIDPSWLLTANVSAPTSGGTVGSNLRVLEAATPTTVLTGIGNVAETGLGISYTLAPAVATEAMAFSVAGSNTITLTYTLGEDG